MPEIDLGYVLGPRGKDGEPGRDGADGKDGAPGATGADGKSAYQYAKEGGFVGTEEQFYTALAEVVLKMNKVIPQKVDSIATLSAAGQAQDSGKIIADFATAEQIKNVYTKKESDAKYAGKDTVYTKDETMTAATGQLFGSDVKTPDQALKAIKKLMDENESSLSIYAKIVTGSYIGNGKFGKENPNSLTFESVPKAVFIQPIDYGPFHYSRTERGMFWVSGTTGSDTEGQDYMQFSLSGNTLSWYVGGSSGNAEYQQNKVEKQYNYLAII